MSDILRTFAKNIKHVIDMKKAVFVLAVLVLGVSGLRAQHFEWAKGYSSSQEGNRIVGSVTDSAGNLYILGNFRNDASWDGGLHLLPMAPYGPYTNVYNLLIAKITPDGTMAWKKVIHANNGKGATPYDIKMVGDSAFTCLLDFVLPYEGYNYCYYLDTLLTTTSDYPVPNGNMSYASRTAFITFDFEGHVLEQHFLTLTYLDNDGNDLMRHYDPPITPSDWYINSTSSYQSTFDIDADGNVYFCRIANDFIDQTYATWLGTIGGIKYWVDGRVVGQTEVQNNPLMWYPQLLKFSPHMDTLLASRYLVQRCDTNIDYEIRNLFLKLDHEGNPYLIGTLNQSYGIGNKITIDSIKSISFCISSANPTKGFMGIFHDNLEAIQGISLEDSVINPSRQNSFLTFHDIAFDSNLVFLSATSTRGFLQDTSIFYSILLCQGVPLLQLRNDGFVMAFQKEQDTLNYITHFHPSGKWGSCLNSSVLPHGNLACGNNRVIVQSFYTGGINSQNILFSNWSNVGLGISIFDYQGHLIQEISYSAFSPNNNIGPISLNDSVLYIINNLVSDAIFGDIHVLTQGSNACIAKYVDTSFLTPYVYTGDTGNVRIVVDDGGVWVSYPNPFRQRVHIQVESSKMKVENGEVTAWLTEIQGWREAVRLQPDGPNRYVLDLTGRPQATYLLTLVTADGQERTLRLLKQSDMFGE